MKRNPWRLYFSGPAPTGAYEVWRIRTSGELGRVGWMQIDQATGAVAFTPMSGRQRHIPKFLQPTHNENPTPGAATDRGARRSKS